MDVIWFSIALLAQLSVSHGITWPTQPGVMCTYLSCGAEVKLSWEYELGGTDPNPPAIRWYKGNTTAGALIATYLFQQGTFHPNYPYNSTGKIDFNQTAAPGYSSATIIMTAIEATDLSQYSVVIQDVGDNTNAKIVEGDLEFNDTIVVDGKALTLEPVIHNDTININNLNVTLVGCTDALTANISISYTDTDTTTPTQIANCTDDTECTSGPVSSNVSITVTLEAVITQTQKAVDLVSFDMVPVFPQTVSHLTVTLWQDVTIPWVYSWTPNNYTALRWMKDNQEIALYDFSTKTFEANDKMGFNTGQAQVDASLTIYQSIDDDAGSYTVDLFGEYTSQPTVLGVIVDEEEDSGLSQAAKIGIGVGVSLGVIAIVLAIVLPLTVCQPKSKDSDHSDTGGQDSYDIEPRSQTNKL